MEFGIFDHLDRTGAALPDFYEDRFKIVDARPGLHTKEYLIVVNDNKGVQHEHWVAASKLPYAKIQAWETNGFDCDEKEQVELLQYLRACIHPPLLFQ